ncbi:2-methylcitrate dehydratase PrpD [Sphingobium faniae]|nr:2-methylcitrate dehydratase PrpD [Sphingobium faniae]
MTGNSSLPFQPTSDAEAGAGGLTQRLIERSAMIAHPLAPDVAMMAKACLLDWTAVTIAGAAGDEIDILVDDATADGPGAHPLIGRPEQVNVRDAVFINGVASHVLDYDDGLGAMSGHASVPIVPALLGVARMQKVRGAELLRALAVATEMAGCIGRLVAPGHYERGFHATATIGAMAAARGCALLLGLDARATTAAVGLAAVRAGGLKASFGSAAKPVQAGWAALVGFTAARWAAASMTAPPDVLGHEQGFVAAQADAGNLVEALAPAPRGAHILQTQFKRYASCGVTHAMLDALYFLARDRPLSVRDLDMLEIRIGRGADRICNIATPQSGLEAKFSLRALAIMALMGVDLADPATFATDAFAAMETGLYLDRVRVILMDEWPATRTHLILRHGGQQIERPQDGAERPREAKEAWQQVAHKFHSLVPARLGRPTADRLFAFIDAIEEAEDASQMFEAAALNTGASLRNRGTADVA